MEAALAEVEADPLPTGRFDVHTAPREQVLAMLREEDRRRKSDTTQQLYDDTKHLLGDQVEQMLQRSVLKAFGFAPSQENLQRYWQIRTLYEDDSEIMNSVVYLRYSSLLHSCAIPLGGPCPDASLVTVDGERPVLLSSNMKSHEKLVVLAGSMT